MADKEAMNPFESPFWNLCSWGLVSCECASCVALRGGPVSLFDQAMKREPDENSVAWMSPVRSPLTVARPRGIFSRFPFHSPIEGEHLETDERTLAKTGERVQAIVQFGR